MARHILIHGRPLALEEMVEKVEGVTNADLKALAERLVQSAPTLAAIGPIDTLPEFGDFAASFSGGNAGSRR
jgi:predicted Zn-dependent peptidase